MNKLSILKAAAQIVTTAGVSKVMNDTISANTTADSTEDKIKVAVGSLVLGSIVVDHAQDHVTEKIEKTVAAWKDMRSKKTDTTE